MSGRTLLSLWGIKPPDTVPTIPDSCLITPENSSSPKELLHNQVQTDSESYHPCLASSPPTDSVLAGNDGNGKDKIHETRKRYLVTLHASPDLLKSHKPKVHSFFAKRKQSQIGPKIPVDNSQKALCLGHPPWTVDHVGYMPYVHDTPPIQRRLSTDPTNSMRSSRENFCKLPGFGLARPVTSSNFPQRILATFEETLSMGSRFANGLSHLTTKIVNKSAFDQGLFESVMWAEKYSPICKEECLNARESGQVFDWISCKLKQLTVAPPRKMRKTELDDFVVDDDFNDQYEDLLPNILVISGPCGSGKTASVYAAASELDAFVVELNTSSRRAGRDLASIIDGVGQSHSVHSRQKCLVLIEDADLIFEPEYGSFWPQLERLASTSRRPVILTCSDPFRVPLSTYDTTLVNFSIPNAVRVTHLCLLIALAEGYILDIQDVADRVVAFRSDIRKSITDIQFWCQILSVRPSGIDWYPKQREMDVADRVLTRLSALPSPLSRCEKQTDSDDTVSIEHYLHHLEAHSSLDVSRYTTRLRPSTEETVGGYYVLSNHIEDDQRYRTIRQDLKNLSDLQHQSPVHTNAMRQALQRISFNTDKVMATEVAPYARVMALADRERCNNLEKYAADGSRMTRRAWQTVGLDGRQHFDGDHEAILASSSWTRNKALANDN